MRGCNFIHLSNYTWSIYVRVPIFVVSWRSVEALIYKVENLVYTSWMETFTRSDFGISLNRTLVDSSFYTSSASEQMRSMGGMKKAAIFFFASLKTWSSYAPFVLDAIHFTLCWDVHANRVFRMYFFNRLPTVT